MRYSHVAAVKLDSRFFERQHLCRAVRQFPDEQVVVVDIREAAVVQELSGRRDDLLFRPVPCRLAWVYFRDSNRTRAW
jgi:hypothetical protein